MTVQLYWAIKKPDWSSVSQKGLFTQQTTILEDNLTYKTGPTKRQENSITLW